MSRLLPFAIFLAFVAAPALANAEPWRLVARCESSVPQSPGLGLFEVRYKARDGNAEAIDVRGCGKNRKFHRIFKWGGDDVLIRVYGLPFFSKDRLDILIEQAWDDSASYSLFSTAGTSGKSIVSSDEAVVWFAGFGAPYFGAADSEGRWGIHIEHLEEFSCGKDKDWSAQVLKDGRVTLTADTLCPSAAAH